MSNFPLSPAEAVVLLKTAAEAVSGCVRVSRLAEDDVWPAWLLLTDNLIAQLQARGKPAPEPESKSKAAPNAALLSITDMAAKFQIGRRTVAERWVQHPSFPAPRYAPTQQTRLWDAAAVEKWAGRQG